MIYHSTTGFYIVDENDNVVFSETVSTAFGSAYQFDLEEDNVKEYYYAGSRPDLALGSFKLVRVQDEYCGIDDKTANDLNNTISSGKLSQTFITAKDDRKLGNELIFGSAEERKFFSDNSSDEGTELFKTDRIYYSCLTKLADTNTIRSLSQYVISGEIRPEKLESGEEILIAVKSGESPLNVGESLTVGSAATSNGFGVEKLSLSDTKVGAVIQIPKDMDRILKYAVSAGDTFCLLTTADGADALGLHAAKYTELFAREQIGSILPTCSGLDIYSYIPNQR